MRAASCPPRSSPYFLLTPKRKPSTRFPCCNRSMPRAARSIGFMGARDSAARGEGTQYPFENSWCGATSIVPAGARRATPMAESAGLHEPAELLSPETIDRHRAIVSIQEELEAVDWYDQRV